MYGNNSITWLILQHIIRQKRLKNSYTIGNLVYTKTSLHSGVPFTSSKAVLSDGGVVTSTPTAEKPVLKCGRVFGLTGILV